MRYVIAHECRSRIRIRVDQKHMSLAQAELPDGLSIAVSVLRMDFSRADSVMFLLRLGELLGEWTHKKSVDDLARCMSLNVAVSG